MSDPLKPGDRVVWASAMGPRPGVVVDLDASGAGQAGAWAVLAVLQLDENRAGRHSFVNAAECTLEDEPAAELDGLLATFAAAEGDHRQVLAQVHAAATAPPLDLTLDGALSRFALSERHRAILLADGGWTSDLAVFLGHVLQKIDPSLRASFPSVNLFLEGLAAGIPGGGIALAAVLAIAEGPLLSLVELWLASRAAAIERRRAAAQG